MKTPYISNYIEEFPLYSSAALFYDNQTQISYLNEKKELKAYEINTGPKTTILTETVENSDTDYFGPDTTEKTATIENADYENFLLGPDTTKTTFTVEPDDQQEPLSLWDPQTTIITRTIENSDDQ